MNYESLFFGTKYLSNVYVFIKKKKIQRDILSRISINLMCEKSVWKIWMWLSEQQFWWWKFCGEINWSWVIGLICIVHCFSQLFTLGWKLSLLTITWWVLCFSVLPFLNPIAAGAFIPYFFSLLPAFRGFFLVSSFLVVFSFLCKLCFLRIV